MEDTGKSIEKRLQSGLSSLKIGSGTVVETDQIRIEVEIVDEEPWEGYDELNAQEVVDRLAMLSARPSSRSSATTKPIPRTVSPCCARSTCCSPAWRNRPSPEARAESISALSPALNRYSNARQVIRPSGRLLSPAAPMRPIAGARADPLRCHIRMLYWQLGARRPDHRHRAPAATHRQRGIGETAHDFGPSTTVRPSHESGDSAADPQDEFRQRIRRPFQAYRLRRRRRS